MLSKAFDRKTAFVTSMAYQRLLNGSVHHISQKHFLETSAGMLNKVAFTRIWQIFGRLGKRPSTELRLRGLY